MMEKERKIIRNVVVVLFILVSIVLGGFVYNSFHMNECPKGYVYKSIYGFNAYCEFSRQLYEQEILPIGFDETVEPVKNARYEVNNEQT
jgi:hypothetical protein